MTTPPPPPAGPPWDPSAAPTRRLTPPTGPPPVDSAAIGYQPPTAVYPPGLGGGPYGPPLLPVSPPPRRRVGLVVGIVVGILVLIGGAVGAYVVFGPKYVEKADLERNLTDLRSALAQAPQSASCPDGLRAEKDRSIDCTLRLADGTDVPARVTVTGIDGTQADLSAEAAVIPKTNLEKVLSEDVARQYMRIAMTCTGDLAGVQGASTTCDGTDANGTGLHVKATFGMLAPDLTVTPVYTPFDTAAEVATVVTDTYANEGIAIRTTCDDDLLGEIGKTTKCQITATSDNSTADVTVTVTSIEKDFVLRYSISAPS